MGVCINKSEEEVSEPVDHPVVNKWQTVRLSTVPIHQDKPQAALQDQLQMLISEVQSKARHHSLINRAMTVDKFECSSRVSVQGVLGICSQQGFEDKAVHVTGDFSVSNLQSMGIGVACKKGLKQGIPNQDDFSVVLDPAFSLFSVFDGHGSCGHQIANYVKTTLPKLLCGHEQFSADPAGAITAAFSEVNARLTTHCAEESPGFDCFKSGTTASTVLVHNNELFIGHAGNSKVVLAARTGDKHVASTITTDHTPSVPSERERIQAQGGEIRQLDGDRVYEPGSEEPALLLSRTLGDQLAHRYGVTAEPSVTKLPLSESTEFLIICSDGVWKHISEQDAVNVVSKYGSNCKMSADRLASMAWTKWIQHEEDYVDDITAVVVYLPLLVAENI